MVKQRTLKTAVQAMGIGLHTGESVELSILPASADTGIMFRRVDLDPNVLIPAHAKNVGETHLCTSISQDGATVGTIEHLMSAFAGLGIDNAIVEVNAPELPIMDGSSAPFVFLLQSAGIQTLAKAKRYIRIKKKIEVKSGDKFARLLPFQGFKVKFAIDFKHPVFIGRPQQAEVNFTETSYVDAICRARTFGFLADYEALRQANLAKGGSLDNAVVVDDYRVLNQEGLRFDDEFVKHKILDAVGDLFLLGSGLIGAFEGYKSGHELNNQLLLKLLASPEAWEYTSFNEAKTNSMPFLPFVLPGVAEEIHVF